MAIDGFEESGFRCDGVARRVFKAGSGPGVILMHEIDGISRYQIAFARRLLDEGYTVWMPYLFETSTHPGSPPTGGMRMVRACLSREIVCFFTGRTSPITDWLRALATELHGKAGGPGVGVIGMCLSGGFALAMVLERSVVAPVMSQPSLPLGILPFQRRDLGLSAKDREAVVRRITDEGLCVLGLRFCKDLISPKDRFAMLRAVLGSNFDGIELPREPRVHFRRFAHSVVSAEPARDDLEPAARAELSAAAERVFELFRTRLRG